MRGVFPGEMRAVDGETYGIRESSDTSSSDSSSLDNCVPPIK